MTSRYVRMPEVSYDREWSSYETQRTMSTLEFGAVKDVVQYEKKVEAELEPDYNPRGRITAAY